LEKSEHFFTPSLKSTLISPKRNPAKKATIKKLWYRAWTLSRNRISGF